MLVRHASTPALFPALLRFACTLLVVCAVAACASSPALQDRPVATTTPAAVRSNPYVTGSRLAVPVDSRTGLPEADPSLQVVTREQIGLTGQTNLGAALRQQLTAIQ
jgi:hypothetical protein